MLRPLWSAMQCVVFWCGGSTASAAEPDLAVVGIHEAVWSEEHQLAVSQRIVEAIDRSQRFKAVPPMEVSKRIAGRESVLVEDAFLAPGRRMLDDGRLLYEQAQAEEAVLVLENAVEALREGVATVGSTRELWEAWVYLGTARFASDDVSGAKQAWAAAGALNPQRQPDSAKFSPDVIAAYTETRAGLSSTGLNVTTETPARLWIDGDVRGDTPQSVGDIFAGEHHLVVRTQDGRRGYARVQCEAGLWSDVTLPLDSPRLGSGGDTKFARGRQTAALYRALATRSELEWVLLLGQSPEGPQVQLYSAKVDAFSRPIAVEDPSPAGWVKAVEVALELVDPLQGLPSEQRVAVPIALDASANSLLGSLLLDPERLRPKEEKPEEEPIKVSKKKKSWVLYAVIGAAGAAAIGTGVGIGVATAGAGDRGTINIGPLQ